jgi:hypothetical protein
MELYMGGFGKSQLPEDGELVFTKTIRLRNGKVLRHPTSVFVFRAKPKRAK